MEVDEVIFSPKEIIPFVAVAGTAFPSTLTTDLGVTQGRDSDEIFNAPPRISSFAKAAVISMVPQALPSDQTERKLSWFIIGAKPR